MDLGSGFVVNLFCCFSSKQCRSKTIVPYTKTFFNSGQRLDFIKNDYNIPKNWECIFKENLIFPSNFLSLGYKIRRLN